MTKFNHMACMPKPDAAANAELATDPHNEATDPAVAAGPKARSKISRVIDLLRRRQGALLTEIVEMSGWQPHTARAALTGLKKRGHTIETRRLGKQTTYFLA